MSVLVVVDRAEDWPLDIPGVEVVPARRYLTDPAFSGRRGAKVFNLCRRYRYQSLGYYVSLLAQARGHRPLPSVATIRDLRHRSLVRLISEDLEELISRSLDPLTGNEFTLSIYFARNVAKRHQRLSRALFNLFPAPLLRATFVRKEEEWELQNIRPIAAREIPEHHHEFVIEAAREYFAGRTRISKPPQPARYDLAILVNPEEDEPPSDERAIRRFVRAADEVGFEVEVIEPDDIGRLAEFDALFIRETTAVEHHTYRFSRRAEAEGLVVIDDPDSIVRCSNKVYLAEALTRAKIPTPRTEILHRDNVEEVAAAIGFPCILKRPDSSFSQGVVRIEDIDRFRVTTEDFLEQSELLIVQEFLPTDFDWRVGVLDRRVLYAARYMMARDHWQIIKRGRGGNVSYGRAQAVALEEVPGVVLETALAAANLMGDGFYGVDVKERDGKPYVIEVNDNPSVEAGYEDTVAGDQLYLDFMKVMMERVEKRRRGLEANSAREGKRR
ncbi:MAG TPA: RimK family protein [Thermoanaerobaculia bacterium]|nr:RimK family protein [Thermoanaerobaculia bacterium]